MSACIIAAAFQLGFTIWFIITHWISLPPLNDLSKEAFPSERITNLILHFLQFVSIVGFWLELIGLIWFGVIFWTVLLMGHIVSWWLPYFFGWPKAFLQDAKEDNARTYHFLPPRKNHPIPDLTHCIIGVLALGAFVSSWIALLEVLS